MNKSALFNPKYHSVYQREGLTDKLDVANLLTLFDDSPGYHKNFTSQSKIVWIQILHSRPFFIFHGQSPSLIFGADYIANKSFMLLFHGDEQISGCERQKLDWDWNW
jgi:hypothetical protein